MNQLIDAFPISQSMLTAFRLGIYFFACLQNLHCIWLVHILISQLMLTQHLSVPLLL